MHRGVAQVVAHLTGGQGVASSSLVTPTNRAAFCRPMLFSCNYAKNRIDTRLFENAKSDMKLYKAFSKLLKTAIKCRKSVDYFLNTKGGGI